jgi:hypothetical protein
LTLFSHLIQKEQPIKVVLFVQYRESREVKEMAKANAQGPEVSKTGVQKKKDCRHHWMIQPATGPVSDGICQNCGDVQQFFNSIDYEAAWRKNPRNPAGPTVHTDIFKESEYEDL